MLTKDNINTIIEKCREMSVVGLKSGVNASLPELEVDILNPPNDFLGANNNPAVFINDKTFNLLKGQHSNWVPNRTIALKSTYLLQDTIYVIGAIIHETGHAFNAAAKIPNTETNAYIFEIEILLKLYKTKSVLLLDCSEKEMQEYFKSRLAFYEQKITRDEWLSDLIIQIKNQFKLEEPIQPKKEISTSLISLSASERYTWFAQTMKANQEKLSLLHEDDKNKSCISNNGFLV